MNSPDPFARAADGLADLDRPDTVNCPVCPHPIVAHDAVDMRYCRATIANALTRRCICAGR
jgi:hypothetical protein